MNINYYMRGKQWKYKNHTESASAFSFWLQRFATCVLNYVGSNISEDGGDCDIDNDNEDDDDDGYGLVLK